MYVPIRNTPDNITFYNCEYNLFPFFILTFAMHKTNLLITYRIQTMRKTVLSCLMLLGVLGANGRQLGIQTPNMSLVIQADEGQQANYVYFGPHLQTAMQNNLPYPMGGNMNAYPAYGMGNCRPAALSVRHADGNMSTQLVVTGSEQQGDVTTIHMKDRVYGLTVDLKYKSFSDVDMIETWAEITNKEKGTVTLSQFASATLPIRRGDVWISHLYGAWGNECQVAEEPLLAGEKLIRNRDGVRNATTEHAEVMFSLDGKAQENTGRVIGAALCYSGNYLLQTVTDESEYHYFFAGIDAQNSEYHLKRGETFVTPHLALTYSTEGLSGASRNFHRWGREYRLMHGNEPRMILLNSWEGVYMNVNEPTMDQMMGDIADMGGELFVMDDGWFGTKYRRTIDDKALGDWEVDTVKLPHGIPGLINMAKKHGIKFGIWIEPEMTNTKSRLYEKHPDWIVKAPKRDAVTGRGGTQLVLDMGNPEVQDFVFSVVDRLKQQNPDLAYIKWDANMHIANHGSQCLPAADQSELFINYHRGLEKTLQRIRDKYPDLIIQACASGGGRANWGVLPYFDEFWVSDNTDALQRIYIQWGTSYFFPSMTMACHISKSPNPNTGRIIPLKYRIDVAMSGRLGMELQPKDMTDEEKTICRKAIGEYKQIRPIVQLGNLYRLVSPYDKKGVASMMYVNDDKSKAVFFWWKLDTFVNAHLPRVRMAGLDPDRLYTVHELDRTDKNPLWCEGKQFTGAYLMNEGLEMPTGGDWNMNGWASRVLSLE